jgi:RNA polymerase sigma-70 factor (ECF subfamily)
MDSSQIDSLDDGELIARLRAGESQALAVLYLRHGTAVYTLLRRVFPLLGAAELEDLRQEIFLSLPEAAARYRHQGKALPWLFGIAIRHTRARLRDARRRDTLLSAQHRPGVGLAAASEGGSEGGSAARLDVQRALLELTDDQREVLLLHTLEGMDGEEIALALGVRPKTVWTRLHRARKKLQEFFASDGAGNGEAS